MGLFARSPGLGLPILSGPPALAARPTAAVLKQEAWLAARAPGLAQPVCGTSVCGTPEPGFGVAGLFCAQPQRPNINKKREKKSDALGERCIVFRELPTTRGMQRAATQMARQP